MTPAEQLFKSTSLFEKCDDGAIQRLALSARWHCYKTGDTILFQGMISHQLFFIASGRAVVFTRKDRETRQVAVLEAGSYFGEISLLTNKAATATIKADEEDTQIYVLERDAVVEALSRNPEAMADVAEKVRQRNQSRLEAFSKEEAPAVAPA